MLLNFLKSLLRNFGRGPTIAADEYPVVRQERMMQASKNAPMDAHVGIVYEGMRIGEHDLADLVRRCLADSNGIIRPYKLLHRMTASYILARYYLHALGLEGRRAECGVFLGTSSLLMCRAARTRDPGHTGAGMHLVDSFEGLSASVDTDRYSVPRPDGRLAERRNVEPGMFNAGAEQARMSMKEFPDVSFHRGWIPAVFAELPESRWSFVHIDVDLYEPTYACLDYFVPRLTDGGVIICDDYGAPLFPGASRAWNRYCGERGVPFVVHDTGQAVLLKR